VTGLGLSFKVFVVAALFAAWRQRRATQPTRSLHAFLGVALAASLLPLLTQRDQWPFSTWPLVAAQAPSTTLQMRVMGVDARVREHDIDYRAWYPLSFDELMAWLQEPFMRLSAVDRDRALAFLLEKAEGARRRAREQAVGDPSPLGRLGAPLFVLHPRRWNEPWAVPDVSFLTLRIYRESWSPEARSRGAAVVRVLIWEGPAHQ